MGLGGCVVSSGVGLVVARIKNEKGKMKKKNNEYKKKLL